MASKVPLRDLSPLMQTIRAFLLGRHHLSALRSAYDISPRDQPDPVFPDGPHDKLSANYYYTRDGRREQKPPTLVLINSVGKSLQLGAKAAESKSTDVAVKKLVTPGKVFHWD